MLFCVLQIPTDPFSAYALRMFIDPSLAMKLSYHVALVNPFVTVLTAFGLAYAAAQRSSKNKHLGFSTPDP